MVIGLAGQYNPGKPKRAGQLDCVADREKWFVKGLSQIGQVKLPAATIADCHKYCRWWDYAVWPFRITLVVG